MHTHILLTAFLVHHRGILLNVSELTFVLRIALFIVLADERLLVVSELSIDKSCEGIELMEFTGTLCQLKGRVKSLIRLNGLATMRSLSAFDNLCLSSNLSSRANRLYRLLRRHLGFHLQLVIHLDIHAPRDTLETQETNNSQCFLFCLQNPVPL